jgi:hypothetical protein
MANQRSGTRDWLPWFSFLGEGIIECVFCQKKYVYVKKWALEHYGLGALRPWSTMAKTQRIVCTKMPTTVRRQFQNCGGNAPPRMMHMELYGTLAASSGATQPGEAPSSTQSTHTAANADLERSDGAPVEEPLESSQEHSQGDSCNPRSLR